MTDEEYKIQGIIRVGLLYPVIQPSCKCWPYVSFLHCIYICICYICVMLEMILWSALENSYIPPQFLWTKHQHA